MSKYNKAKRLANRAKRLYDKAISLSNKVSDLHTQGKITKDEYNSLAD